MIDLRSSYPAVGYPVERIDPPAAPFRIYKANGKTYPSVTTVLQATRPKPAALLAWEQRLGPVESKRQLEQAGRDGTRAHLIFEGVMTGHPIKPTMPDDVFNFNVLFRVASRAQEVWGSELQLFSDELEMAGTCDWAGIFENDPSMIDLKTSKRELLPQDIADHDYWTQTGIYARMFQQRFNKSLKKLIIIQLPHDCNDLVITKRNNDLDMNDLMRRREEFRSKFGV